MPETPVTILDISDKNGNPINNGDEIIFENNNYIAMQVGKDGSDWVGHPCGNNSNEPIVLDDKLDQIELIVK